MAAGWPLAIMASGNLRNSARLTDGLCGPHGQGPVLQIDRVRDQEFTHLQEQRRVLVHVASTQLADLGRGFQYVQQRPPDAGAKPESPAQLDVGLNRKRDLTQG